MPTDPTSAAKPRKTRRKSTAGDTVGKAIAFLMLAFTSVAMTVVSCNDFVSLKDDLWLNSHGTLARNPSLHVHHGRRTASELCAYYDTQQGKSYDKCIPLWFPLVLIDEHSPEIIHYNPVSPEHISTSWGRQILFSRTLMLLLATVFAFLIDVCSVLLVIQKITGMESSDSLPDTAPTPASPISGQPATNRTAPATEAIEIASSSLQADALKLSATLDQIVTNLESNSGPNSAYARASAAELAPLVAQFHGAVLAHSREQASEALNSIVEFMNDFIADARKRKMSFGVRHWLAMRTYDDLHDIFRATKYRDTSL